MERFLFSGGGCQVAFLIMSGFSLTARTLVSHTTDMHVRTEDDFWGLEAGTHGRLRNHDTRQNSIYLIPRKGFLGETGRGNRALFSHPP